MVIAIVAMEKVNLDINKEFSMRTIALLGIVFYLTGCSPFSETVVQPTAGFNGSFETVQDHLPVNWLLYTKTALNQSDFEFDVPEGDASDGARSVHFDIRKCNPEGGHLSPGIATELAVESNHTYSISFDTKNKGSKLVFEAGPVSLKNGNSHILLTESTTLDSWTTYSFDVEMPATDSILFLQWNWVQPGQGWLDNVRVTKKI